MRPPSPGNHVLIPDRMLLILFGLETIVRRIAQGCHHFADVLLDVFLGVFEVVVHHVLGIEAELGRLFGLLGVVEDQELIAAEFIRLVDALGRQGIFDPQLGRVHVLRALEDGG